MCRITRGPARILGISGLTAPTALSTVDAMGAPSDVHVLQFVAGKYRGEEFALAPEADYLAGRSTEADLVIKDDLVSRKHARFYHSRGRVWLRDLGSRNGTSVNGEEVLHHCLTEGDRIAIGSNLLRVEMVPASQLSRRTAKDDAGSARSMSGTLEDIPLTDVLQWLATSRKTGALVVRGQRDGWLYLREGQVFSARIEGSDVGPQKAVLRMLGWAEGTFGLDNQVPEETGEELATSLDHLLMEAARQQDELAHLADRKNVPEEAVELAFPPGKPWKDLEPLQIDVLQAIAAGMSWSGVLDALPDDDVKLTKTAIELHKAGVVKY